MSDSALLPKIAVVIATKDRGDVLAQRAFPSVAAQRRAPDFLVVVDDSSASFRLANRETVASLSLRRCRVTYLENERTPGASGSWNTALDFLFRRVGDPAALFVAVLDDDDEWAPDYLDRCVALAHEQELHMVGSDILRFEEPNCTPLKNEAPELLRSDDFLIGNPGIQGSNLFLLLSVLLAAGGFDESLRSTTDRDLCIRISDAGTARYGRLAASLVHHFAESSRPRLSTRGSLDKLQGLSAFWRKHSGRMTDIQREAFCKRGRTLFDWLPEAAPGCSDLAMLIRRELTEPQSRERTGYTRVRAKPELRVKRVVTQLECTPNPENSAPDHAPFRLHIGIISSDPLMLSPLLHGLVALRVSPSIEGLTVVVLDNGSPANELQKVIEDARRAGLSVAVVSVAQQQQDAGFDAFGETFHVRPEGQVGIAQARTMLQRYLGTLLHEDAGSFGWMLDDDMRVDERVLTYIPWLPAFRSEGVDVLIGQYEGASPNPPLNGIRVQLVDLLHNLKWLSVLSPDAILPDRSAENAELRATYPDYYYDLSRKHTGHLETPYWFEPAFPGESVSEAYARLLAGALGILFGDPLTRSLVTSMPLDPLAVARDSVNRGGCTFILNSRSLTDTPNMTLRIRGREARRSDMIWAIVNRYYRRMEIKAVGFPIWHLGRAEDSPSLNIEKVQGELIGSALYGGLTEFLGNQPQHELGFSAAEIEQVCSLAYDHLVHRLGALEQSFLRIAGLRDSIRKTVEPGELDELLLYLERWFTPTTFTKIRAGVQDHSREEVSGFLASLRRTADDFAAASVNIDFLRKQLHQLDSGPLLDI